MIQISRIYRNLKNLKLHLGNFLEKDEAWRSRHEFHEVFRPVKFVKNSWFCIWYDGMSLNFLLWLDLAFGYCSWILVVVWNSVKETLISFALVAKLEGKRWQGHLCYCNTCSIVIIVNVLDLDTGPNTKSVWWFQIFFIFTSTWGDDPIWRLHIFHMGWNSTTEYQIGFRMYSWVFPKMVVPPFHTPSAGHYIVGKPMGLLGKPTILGNPQLWRLHFGTCRTLRQVGSLRLAVRWAFWDAPWWNASCHLMTTWWGDVR